MGNNYKPPKIYIDKDKPSGILIDIIRYIEDNTQHSFDLQLVPWKRAYNMSLTGCCGIIGLSKNQERQKSFDFSEAIYYDEIVMVVKKGREFSYNKLEDLQGKVVGVRRGSSYGDKFERGKKSVFKVFEDTDAIQRLNLLLTERIDVALIGPGKLGVDTVIANNSDLRAKKDHFVVLDKPFVVDPNYIGFAKQMNKKPLLEKINLAIRKGHQTGAFKRIIAKYSQPK